MKKNELLNVAVTRLKENNIPELAEQTSVSELSLSGMRRSDDYVLFAALCHGCGGALDCPVVGFGTAGGEINLVRLCAEDGSYLLSCALKRPARFAAL